MIPARVAALAVCLLSAAAAAQSSPPAEALPARGPQAAMLQPEPLQALRQSARHLRASIDAIALRQEGPARGEAIAAAKAALAETRSAIDTLAPSTAAGSPRVRESAPASASDQLLRATERLSTALDTLSREPPGAARNRAMAHMHEALQEIEDSMAALPS
jgi:hypothetical protein